MQDTPTIADQPSQDEKESHALDWGALGVVVVGATLFALAGRLSPLPSTSLTPIAVLSATGCGFLITTMRKLCTKGYSGQRSGIAEAALGGFSLVLVQCVAAISYPGIFSILRTVPEERVGFLTTWALMGVFSVLFSLGGALLGQVASAPVRPLRHTLPKARDPLNNLVLVVFFGLAPTMAGYVFSAAYDLTLTLYHFPSGPYPTLRLLSALLPWQIPATITLNAANANLLILLLWRIPLFLGNSHMFDIQALEPYIFNGIAFGLLFLTKQRQQNTLIENSDFDSAPLPWRLYLILEAALGLVMILPAALWMVEGIQGVLHISTFVMPIRTLHLLDTTTFIFNVIGGPMVCVGIGTLVHVLHDRFPRRWSSFER